MRTRRCGAQKEELWEATTQIAESGAMTKTCFAMTVTRAKLVCWLH